MMASPRKEILRKRNPHMGRGGHLINPTTGVGTTSSFGAASFYCHQVDRARARPNLGGASTVAILAAGATGMDGFRGQRPLAEPEPTE